MNYIRENIWERKILVWSVYVPLVIIFWNIDTGLI